MKTTVAKKPLINALFVSAALSLFTSFSCYTNVNNYRTELDNISKTRNIRRYTVKTLSAVTNCETSQRGYLLTHKSTYLKLYKENSKLIPVYLFLLKTLDSKETLNVINFQTINPLVNNKMRELSVTITLENMHKHQQALSIVNTNEGENTMTALRNCLSYVNYQEYLVQSKQEFQIKHDTTSTMETILMLGGLNLLIILLCLAMIIK